jgi:hypothetical protein
MNTTFKIIIAILSISIIGAIAVEVLTYFFGADGVFFGALYSIPLLLVWCIMTDKSIDKEKEYEFVQEEIEQ